MEHHRPFLALATASASASASSSASAAASLVLLAADDGFVPLCNGKDLAGWRNPYDTDAKGHLGIQHHGEKGQTYMFRNLRLKTL